MAAAVALPGPLVTGEWLFDHLHDVVVADVRWYLNPEPGRTGRVAYTAGHIPTAVFVDIDTDLAAAPTAAGGRHPLPSPPRFAAALGARGIAEGTPVVAYDDAGGSTAARLWWLLHALGEPVAVLDGGIGAWPGALTREVVIRAAVARRAMPWPAGRFVDADALAAGIDAGSISAYDARTAARYAHGDPAIDARPGHVPGALSAPWAGNLADGGRFRTAGELSERFAAARGRTGVSYCGSGITACHDLLAMTIAGLDDLALYPGSWSQWGAATGRPVTEGDAP